MNINFPDLEKLIKIAERSNINSLEVTDGDACISIVCRSDDNKDISDNNNNNKRNLASTSGSTQRTMTSAESSQNAVNDSDAVLNKKEVNEDAQNRVTAPMLGTFYRRSEPTADEFVKAEDKVDEGQTLCIIEAMKMMHEVKADFACTIKDVLVDEGDVVEYGQALFVIEPAN
ncbi:MULTISPECIES: acetyl-CoA carboxylase biotin carboxyl carrier protein [unclassified Psychrobacter]|uniref:acetyl-CoA carboxylase biotin carboxyl carrier protein n=1 Tax=unclassified Psychrobacter TaxID=196806 RepID=UPI00071E8AB6|nr:MULTISPECIES: acetyl-CoA carboxylase biotin carboxyl carrier protein [unclassified Psychrobacter]OLF38203.1 acetyl-CoA carboxylase, biotin carboxyl carrier protein [Psychrobacter sp. Cmf 22.2]